MNWLYVDSVLLDLARDVVGFAQNWLLQSTLLISAGLVLAWVLSRLGSAVQSVIYRTTLVGVLTCPLLTWAISCSGVSGWSVQMPEAWTLRHGGRSLTKPAEIESPLAGHVTNTPRIPAAHLGVAGWDSQQPTGQANGADSPQSPVEDSLLRTSDLDLATAPNPSVGDALSPPENVSGHLVGVAVVSISLLWTLTSMWLLGRTAVAWWRLAGIRRDAEPADAETLQICRELSEKLGVVPPAVLRTPFLPSPCLAGLRVPAVLLPDAELSLAMRDVLIHELAHLRRGDCHWNLLRKLATSILWFQPLLWTLSRRLEMAAEEVCDDIVVELGGDREEYAHRLVDVAEFSSVPMATAGVAIVSLRSMLARRVKRILDTSRRLTTKPSALSLTGALTVGCVGTVVIAFLGVSPRSVAEGTSANDEIVIAPTKSIPPQATSDLSSSTVDSLDLAERYLAAAAELKQAESRKQTAKAATDAGSSDAEGDFQKAEIELDRARKAESLLKVTIIGHSSKLRGNAAAAEAEWLRVNELFEKGDASKSQLFLSKALFDVAVARSEQVHSIVQTLWPADTPQDELAPVDPAATVKPLIEGIFDFEPVY